MSVAVACGLAAAVEAQDAVVTAQLDRSRISMDDAARLWINIEGGGRASPPSIDVDGLSVQYVGPSTSITMIDGHTTSTTTFRYSVLPQRPGRFTIGPVPVLVDNRQLYTPQLTLEVLPSTGPTTPAQPGAPAPTSLKLQLAADKTRTYVSERIPARVQLLIGRRGVRQVEVPELKADGLLVKPLGQPVQSDVSLGGDAVSLIEFPTEVVPMRPGRATLGPANISLQVLVRRAPTSRRREEWPPNPFEDFFGEDSPFQDMFSMVDAHPVALVAEPIAIEVLPLPEQGRPRDFAGAVGRFELTAEAVPTEVAAGEPVTITMAVTGEGNFDTVTAPTIELDPKLFKAYEPKLVGSSDDSAAPRKVFEQVVIPLQPSVTNLPTVRFSHFDPDVGQYKTATEGPLPLTVKPAPAHEPPRVVDQPGRPAPPAAAEPLGRDIVFIEEQLGTVTNTRPRWYADPWWLWWQLCPLTMLLISEWFRRRQARLLSDPGAARASGALRRALGRSQGAWRLKQGGMVPEFYSEVFGILRHYLGDRFDLPTQGLTRSDLERHLTASGLPSELLQQVLSLADRCDTARFAPKTVSGSEEMEAALRELESLLLRLEKCKPS